MKKVLLYILTGIGLISCGTTKKTPTQTDVTIVTYKDSIIYHDTTVYHTVYKEQYKDYTGLLDTLKMETTYSEFTAYNDTTARTLKGEAINKDIKLPVEIKWKEKVSYRDSIQYVEKEIPVEVEVTKTVYPKSYWILLATVILTALIGGIKLYLKLKI